MDTRVVGLDEVADAYVNDYFGPAYVSKVKETLHRSTASHEAIHEDLIKYYRTYVGPKVRDDPTYIAVLESVREQFTSPTPLIPLTLGGAFKHPEFPKDKSPGLPWTSIGYRTKGDVLDDPTATGYIFRLWEAIGNNRSHTGLPDTCAFFRAQLAPMDKNKIRAVWGTPIDVIAEEYRFFKPYITWLEETNAPIAYGIEMATGGMSYVNDMCQTHAGETFVMTDYSQFDSSIPPWLIRDAFQIVFDSFDFNKVIGSDDMVWNVNPVRTMRRVKRLLNYFINTPIRLPSGERYRKSGGVPSGSTFTNIIDTIVNAIVMRYVSFETTGHLPTGEMYLGDDSFLILPGAVDLDLISQLALEQFGMTIHPDKSYCTTNPRNVQFLGYFNRNGLPFKPESQLVASFIFPERRVKDNTVRVARAIGQMWSSMHSGLATRWRMMIIAMMNDFDISITDIEEYLRTHPNHFRYLRTLGIDPKKIGLPDMVGSVVPAIDPPWISRKQKGVSNLRVHLRGQKLFILF